MVGRAACRLASITEGALYEQTDGGFESVDVESCQIFEWLQLTLCVVLLSSGYCCG